jgi:hypothetical protein
MGRRGREVGMDGGREGERERQRSVYMKKKKRNCA